MVRFALHPQHAHTRKHGPYPILATFLLATRSIGFGCECFRFTVIHLRSLTVCIWSVGRPERDMQARDLDVVLGAAVERDVWLSW